MVVVDSSALIPLAWVCRLDLVESTFDDVQTTAPVRQELLTEGKRGTAALNDFLDAVTVNETPDSACEVASLDGIAVTDASVILLAERDGEILLANDKGLIEAARSHGVECWWVTTLLLNRAKEGDLTGDEAADILYELVDEGMNLHPKIYARVRQKLRELGE